MSSGKRPTFSPEARLIVASNIAVAEAVWRLIRKGDSDIEESSEMVRTSIANTLKNFDSLVAKNFPAAR